MKVPIDEKTLANVWDCLNEAALNAPNAKWRRHATGVLRKLERECANGGIVHFDSSSGRAVDKAAK